MAIDDDIDRTEDDVAVMSTTETKAMRVRMATSARAATAR